MRIVNQESDDLAIPEMDAEVAELLRQVIVVEIAPYDPGNAIAIIEEARRGNPAAQYIVGVALEMLKPPRTQDAANWYRSAAEEGFTPAAAKLESLQLEKKRVA